MKVSLASQEQIDLSSYYVRGSDIVDCPGFVT
jgi:hypothetical protein